jgi:hypothetical protein
MCVLRTVRFWPALKILRNSGRAIAYPAIVFRTVALSRSPLTPLLSVEQVAISTLDAAEATMSSAAMMPSP